jgi:hypothetical protein
VIDQAAVKLGLNENTLIEKAHACYSAMYGSPEAGLPAVEERPDADDGEAARAINTQPTSCDTRPLKAALAALAEANEPPWTESKPKIDAKDVEGESGCQHTAHTHSRSNQRSCDDYVPSLSDAGGQHAHSNDHSGFSSGAFVSRAFCVRCTESDFRTCALLCMGCWCPLLGARLRQRVAQHFSSLFTPRVLVGVRRAARLVLLPLPVDTDTKQPQRDQP